MVHTWLWLKVGWDVGTGAQGHMFGDTAGTCGDVWECEIGDTRLGMWGHDIWDVRV